jgi:hypothetical protein
VDSSSTRLHGSWCIAGVKGYKNSTDARGKGVVHVCWGTVVVQGYRRFTWIQGYMCNRGVLV